MAEVFWPLSILSKTCSFCSRVKVFLDLFGALPSATEVEGRLGAMVKLGVKQNLPRGKSAKRAGDSRSQHQDVGNNERGTTRSTPGKHQLTKRNGEKYRHRRDKERSKRSRSRSYDKRHRHRGDHRDFADLLEREKHRIKKEKKTEGSRERHHRSRSREREREKDRDRRHRY
ncbi:hypothetical protein Pcinc_026595 [Petrolisthes cinctipes]|uniref:Uncharacterized protein n=1 Tax=Petrolisthes cinctipes TaxID=88211 RepID=A0AAE1F6M6_PETCI|nr:hypothetical protein Pcinc_026595 [Petrolisthes cinctipes]